MMQLHVVCIVHVAAPRGSIKYAVVLRDQCEIISTFLFLFISIRSGQISTAPMSGRFFKSGQSEQLATTAEFFHQRIE